MQTRPRTWHRQPPAAAMLVLLAVTAGGQLRAAPFQNLDFEQATITPAAAGSTPPATHYTPLDAAAALPYWTVIEDTTVCNAVFGQADTLDITSVCLVHLGNLDNPATPPIQGNYDVQLYAVANAPEPILFRTASISQTGDVPSAAKSIQFLIRNPPGASNIPSTPYVFLNGVSIPVVPLSTSNGIITMAGDISAFAGTNATLTFEAQGQISNQNSYEDIYELDGITFASSPVPEPATAALLLAAAPLLMIRQRRAPPSKRQKMTPKTHAPLLAFAIALIATPRPVPAAK